MRPEQCGQCGTLLLGEDAEPERHQVTEIPRLIPVVTEYRRHCLWCVACGAWTQAVWPTTMPTGSFGPRVHATVGYLTGRVGVSQREVHDIFMTLYQMEVSVGGVGALEQAVSAALAAPVAEVQQYVQRQPVITRGIIGLIRASANSAGRISSENLWRGANAQARRHGLGLPY